MQVLVVEDDAVSGALLKKLLSKQGYTVTHVPNGLSALGELQRSSYRMIVTDWMMPEMDGPTLCRHVRGLNLPEYIYIILLTAKDSKTDAVSGLEAGADDYIVKPIDKDEFLARIRAGQRLVELEDKNRDIFRKLSRAEKMGAVGHLAAGVAHEINNPIGFISSNLSTLQGYIHDIQAMLACYREMTRVFNESITQKKMDPRLPRMLKQSAQLEAEYQIDFLIKDAEELTGECRAGADRIKNIVHEMRYFAHPDHQAISSCGIATIVAEAVQPFRAQLPEGISIEIALDGLPEIECNAPHLRQAFANIFKNAIEALDGQGRIVVEGRCENGELIVKVADTGRGISPENLGKLFDPFFTTKAVGQGVGLGLTTALNIVRMHNGSIAAESTPGAMTTLTICLPLREAASP